ncbi:MAG: DUF4430 domain-containing protein [Leptospiraceae bacterium]|nr:DUF4430 domain-containing protein [Leptospiraceae bacterium]MDW7975303.1 DUF4430 domain-containing protein [Leptospiraceae bacterium]
MKRLTFLLFFVFVFGCKEERKPVPPYKVEIQIILPNEVKIFQKEYSVQKSVYEVLLDLQKENQLQFETKGRGETLFLESIAGVSNQGLGDDKNNWIYFVDQKLAQVGMAQMVLEDDSVVVWCFTTWKEKEKCIQSPTKIEGDPHDKVMVPNPAK